MRRSTRLFALLVALGVFLAAVFLAAVPALAGDGETQGGEAPDMAAMMAAMEKAMAPGEHHRWLASFEGDWTFSSKVWMEPGAPPMESPGSSKKAMIMDGRFLQEEISGNMMGKPFHGRGVTAYDNTAGEFIGTWIDSMGTTIAIVKGQRDGDTLEMHGEYLDPMSQQTMKVRYVSRLVDQDTHIFEYYMTPPGAPEMKSMAIEYKRKAAE